MADRLWKQTERAIATRLGGSRVGNRGEATPDVATSWCSVEVKTRQNLPAWLQAAMRQAVGNAWPETLPVVVLHETGQRHDNDLVVLTLADFQQWFGDMYPDGVSGDGEVAENGRE